MNIFELEAALQQDIRSSPEYLELINGQAQSKSLLKQPTMADLKKDAKYWDALFTSTKKEIEAKVHLSVNEGSRYKTYNNIYANVGKYASSFDVLQGALADKNHCLCQMTSGDLQLIPILLMHDRDDIVAVLAFGVSDTGSLCLRYEDRDKQFKTYGILENCSNLKYVAPIPEGITDAAGAFENCTSLNCNIYLPATMTWCPNMLKGCMSFSSTVYYKNVCPKDIGASVPCVKL